MWPGVIKDVKDLVQCMVYVSSCANCYHLSIMKLNFYRYPLVITAKRTNRRITTGTPALNPVPVKSPCHRIGIDYIGPLNPFTNGNWRQLICSDMFQQRKKMSTYNKKMVTFIANFEKFGINVAFIIMLKS